MHSIRILLIGFLVVILCFCQTDKTKDAKLSSEEGRESAFQNRGKDYRFTIGLVGNFANNNLFFQKIHRGVFESADTHKVNIFYWVPKGVEKNYLGERKAIRHLIEYAKVGSLIITPDRLDSLKEELELAKEKNIPVVIIDGKLEREFDISYLGSDQNEAGRLLARRIAERFRELKSVVIFPHVQNFSDHVARSASFSAEIKEKIPLCSVKQVKNRELRKNDEAYQLAVDYLENNPAPSLVYCANTRTFQSFYRAIQLKNLNKETKIIGIGCNKVIYEGLLVGDVLGFVTSSPYHMGSKAVNYLSSTIKHKRRARMIYSDLHYVDLNNINEPYIREILEKSYDIKD